MKILVMIDQSDSAEQIVEFLREFQSQSAVEYKVVHVVEPLSVGSVFSFLPAPLLDEMRDKAFAAGQVAVHKCAELIRNRLSNAVVATEVLNGFVVDTTVQVASTWHADLIAVGTHRRGGANKFTLGNMARAIMTQAPCSVLLAATGEKRSAS
jgi:nucleotide-binding universal stress UspA family protein